MVFQKVALVAACLLASVAQLSSASTLPSQIGAERRLYLPVSPFPNPAYPAPTKDDFYRSPNNLASFKEGDIIREREITKDVNLGYDYSSFSSVYQLLYKTQTSRGAPDVTVTTVFKPKKPAAGPPRVLSLAFFQDASLLDCSTSWAILKNTASNQTVAALLQAPILNAALSKGYYVTAPDFQGGEAAFIAGYGEGRAMLDGTRAILKHKKTVANADGYQVVISGYSGGGHAAGWAAQLANEYAPELNIIGAALGGVPADLKSVLINLNKSLFASVAMSALVGQANAYPEFEEWLFANVFPEGLRILKEIRTSGKCVLQAAFKYAYLDFFALAPNGINSIDEPVPKKIIELNRLGARGSKDIITRFPRYMYHASLDQVIPEAPTSKYVDDQCAGGSSVHYSTALVSEHLIESIVGLPRAFAWIVGIFDETIKQTGCTRSSHGLADVFLPSFEKQVGPVAAKQARANLNFKIPGL